MYDHVIIEKEARSALGAHVSAEPSRETGGILLGHPARDDALLVTGVSPPGPGAVKLSNFFSRDTAFLQRWLERRHRRSQGHDDYVGEWHVHHALNTEPSSVDRRALWRIARRANYPTDSPLLIIAEDVPGERRLRGFIFVAKPKRSYREIPLE